MKAEVGAFVPLLALDESLDVADDAFGFGNVVPLVSEGGLAVISVDALWFGFWELEEGGVGEGEFEAVEKGLNWLESGMDFRRE